MTANELERRRLKKQVREHIREILGKGVSRQRLADELRVTKQAISSYVSGRTTPKPHIVRRLLAKWPRKFGFYDEEFGPEAFGVALEGPPVSLPKQGSLFDLLSAIPKENIRMEVDRVKQSGAELRVIIKFAG